ncbi:MAG: hypothetical protein ILP09_09580 [Oscillospiraceae bacterium]|nr:hypothetical protein [Oscillospiraceae bacterium]
MKRKEKNTRAGESIAETLVAVLIMALAFLMLTTAVTSAARINSAVKNEASAPDTASAPADQAYGLSVRVGGSAEKNTTATLYKTENGYYYYEYDPSN